MLTSVDVGDESAVYRINAGERKKKVEKRARPRHHKIRYVTQNFIDLAIQMGISILNA